MCRAANALQTGRLKWLELALNDAELQHVLQIWKSLSLPIRRAILAIVSTDNSANCGY
jgi:hypothetical protein